MSAFSSCFGEYLERVVKVDQFAQYVDDNGIAANNATDLIRNIRVVFQCMHPGTKLTKEKCHFGVRQVEVLGRTISAGGISPQARIIQSFLHKIRFPNSKRPYSAT